MKYLLLIISWLCCLGANAQIEHSILDSGLHWRVFECDGSASSANFFNYQFTETDTINGNVYHEMSDKGRSYCFREDTATNQVLIYQPQLDTEFVIIDFNLSVGDTLWFKGVKKYTEINSLDVSGATIIDSLITKSYNGEPRFAMQIGLIDAYPRLVSWGSEIFWIDGLFTNVGPEYFEFVDGTWEQTRHHYLHKTTLRLPSDTVTLVEAFGNTNPSSCVTKSIGEIGVEQQIVYPNPGTNEISVYSTAQMDIYNSLGQLVSCPQRQEGGKTHISISHLSNGIYFIRSEEDGAVKTGKFVKE